MPVESQLELPLLGTLPSHWRVVEFGSVLEEGGTRNGIYKKKEFHGSGDKIVNMGELFAHPRLFAVPMKRVQLSENEQQRFRLQAGDLLFARRSLVAEGAGKCSVVCEINEPTTFESSIIRARPDQKIADSLYLYYLFRSSYGTYILDTIRRQVAVSGITGTDLVKLLIPLPPLPEQKAIARILSSLDDKIELNQEMNRTLEAIARAIFKSWFLDFDPVRAKMDSRQPSGMDAATADLFPDSFEDSPLGKVPKGWKVMQLREIANNESEPFDFSSHSEVIFLNTGDLALGKFLHAKYSPKDGLPGQAKKAIQKNDILLSEIRPANGRYAFVDFTPTDYVVSTKFMVIRASSAIEHRLLYRMLTRPEVLANLQVIAESRSGTFPQVTFQSISHLSFVVPPKNIQILYQETVDKLDKKIKIHDSESKTLTTIRDALLPKLLTGEIRIKEVEKVVEAVA